VLEVSVNWNPSYSYSTLPQGYTYETIPSHWRIMLQKVEPPERGIPEIRDVCIERLQVAGARRAISAIGTGESIIKDFQLKDVTIEAETAGQIMFAKGWRFDDVTIETKEARKLDVQGCVDMDL
jgi:hypothetical protein